MNHATEGTLQAYMDGELEAFELAAVERHLGACTACAAELDGLRAAGARFASAVRVLDEAALGAAAPHVTSIPLSLRTRRAWYGPRRTLARAATVIVALGLSAALLEATTGAVSSVVERMAVALGVQEQPTLVAPVEDEAADEVEETRRYTWVAQGETVRFGVEGAPAGLTVRVRLTDGDRCAVTLLGGGEVLVGSDLATIQAGSARTVEITVPRGLARAQVDVNGLRYLTKDGEDLRYAIPPADTADARVEFQVRPR